MRSIHWTLYGLLMTAAIVAAVQGLAIWLNG
jgi:hypothetical protein